MSFVIEILGRGVVEANPEDQCECRLWVSLPADGAESYGLRTLMRLLGKPCETYEMSTVVCLLAREIWEIQSGLLATKLREFRNGPDCCSVKSVRIDVLRIL